MEYGKSLEELMNELQGEKLGQEPPKTVLMPEEEPTNEEIEEVFSPLEADGQQEESPNIKDVSGLPELIVGIIDIFGSVVAEAYTKTDDKSKYRLAEDEKEELTKAWKLYLKNSEDVKISPSTMLLLTTGIVYTPKIIMAINEKKEIKYQKMQQCQTQE